MEGSETTKDSVISVKTRALGAFLWLLLWVKDYVRSIGKTFYGSHLIRPHNDGSYIPQAGQYFLGGMAVGIARTDADDGIGRHDGPKEYIGTAAVAAVVVYPQYVGG